VFWFFYSLIGSFRGDNNDNDRYNIFLIHDARALGTISFGITRWVRGGGGGGGGGAYVIVARIRVHTRTPPPPHTHPFTHPRQRRPVGVPVFCARRMRTDGDPPPTCTRDVYDANTGPASGRRRDQCVQSPHQYRIFSVTLLTRARTHHFFLSFSSFFFLPPPPTHTHIHVSFLVFCPRTYITLARAVAFRVRLATKKKQNKQKKQKTNRRRSAI